MHPHRVDAPRRPRRLITIGLPILGFLLPAVTVYAILREEWPIQHDLSDIGTGLLRFICAVLSGVVGALATVIALRLARR